MEINANDAVRRGVASGKASGVIIIDASETKTVN